MVRSARNGIQSDPTEAPKESKRYRLEMTLRQLILYSTGLVVALSWMFFFGILVGRGIPLVSSKDFSLRAEFVRFLGLGREVVVPPDDTAKTWEDPKKILEALNYYEELTHKGGSPPVPAAVTKPAAPPTPSVLPQKKSADEPQASQSAGQQTSPPQAPPQTQSTPPNAAKSPAQNPKQTPGQPPSQGQKPKSGSEKSSTTDNPRAQDPSKTPPKKTAPEALPAESSGGHFTLLISTSRDADKAKRLFDELKAKGHPARMEVLNMNESGRWSRIMVGSFSNREEATRFAAEFNRKERMEALVIREAH